MGNPPVPSADQIISALSSTGFLFEQKAANILEDTETGWAFKDPDLGTSREIDLFKVGSVYDHDQKYRTFEISWYILGECKNYQWPWVALTKPWGARRWFLTSDDLSLTQAMRFHLGIDDEGMALANRDEETFFQGYQRVRAEALPRAVQLVKLNKKSGGWDAASGDIFNDVTYPLAKASNFLKTRFDDRQEQGYLGSSREMQVIFPVLVVSSQIYAVSANGDPEVKEVGQVTLERTLSSENVSGRFRIDVVHIDHLRDWYEQRVRSVVDYLADSLTFSNEGLRGVKDSFRRSSGS
ncbi:hypothetical protein ACFWNN_25545 [Lentzea sp. NPDC058450]|uniref:hypothetical protein n=1 Tax=Lentzea sp. NPDC058450 TaxID=3346505 RepID=UPI00365BFC87